MTAANAAETLHRLRPVIWVGSAVAVVVFLLWSGGVGAPRDTAPQPVAPTASGSPAPGVERFPITDRRNAPAVTGTTLSGRAVTPADLTGRVVVINVWGSWCAPCREEAPDLVRLANRYADREVSVLGINTKDTAAAATSFVQRFKIPYPSIDDSDGRLLQRFRGIIPTTAIPTTVVVDRQGRIAARIIGQASYQTLNTLVSEELARKGDR